MRSPPWRAVTCATSWASTAARPASSRVIGRIPVYTAIFPPGSAKALACLSSMTRYSHWKSGRSATAAMRLPTRVTRALSSGSVETFDFLRICW